MRYFELPIQTERERQARLLKLFYRVVISLVGASFVVTTLVTIFIEGKYSDLLFGTPPILLVVLLISLGLSRLAARGRYRLASWGLVVNITLETLIVYWRFGTAAPLFVALLVPIGLAIVLLSTREAVGVSAFCIGGVLLLYILQDILGVYHPPVALEPSALTVLGLSVAILFMPATIALWILPARSQTRLLEERNRRLEEALSALKSQQQTNLAVSERVVRLAEDLQASAAQQSSASQQQLGAVGQVTTAVNELASASQQIAQLAQEVDGAAANMERSSQEIAGTTVRSVEESARGRHSLTQTEEASREVTALYERLVATLKELSLKSGNLRRISELLGGFAGETHLLSFNASIEAAGAGVYGGRFGVIAQEVKRLADQSGKTNQEIAVIVDEIEIVSRQAVAAAEEGHTVAAALKTASRQSGEVIEVLAGISQAAHEQARSISTEAASVHRLTHLIKLTTEQQRTANAQVLPTLETMSQVAEQTAEGSGLVSQIAGDLQLTSSQLIVV